MILVFTHTILNKCFPMLCEGAVTLRKCSQCVLGKKNTSSIVVFYIIQIKCATLQYAKGEKQAQRRAATETTNPKTNRPSSTFTE